MAPYKICLVSGWCGNLRFIITEHIEDIFKEAGYRPKITYKNVWENPDPPRSFDLVLQLLPVFKEAEIDCPTVNIKPMLADLNHQPTIRKINQHVENIDPIFLAGS